MKCLVWHGRSDVCRTFNPACFLSLLAQAITSAPASFARRTGDAAPAPPVPHLAHAAAGPAPVHGIDHDPVAGLPLRHGAAGLDDVAGEVDAHDAGHGHLDARHAAAREDVVVVERGGAHLDDHILGPRGG